MRNISAPFQKRDEHSQDASHHQTQHATPDYIDYTNAKFQDLEHVQVVQFDKYVGPTPESNWVIPGRLLVGAYPASQSDVETFELLISILKQGVTSFVCLQQEYRTHGVTEAMWRGGHALRPYFEDVKLIVKNKSMFKSLSEHPNIVDLQSLDFVHFPIRDCSISDDGAVLKLSQSLVGRLHRGERLYVHCWGGHGRTGTVVCIMLHLLYGMDAKSAMAYCQRVHDLRQCPVQVGSPQTETQREQVVRVIGALTQHRQQQHLSRQLLSANTTQAAGQTHPPTYQQGVSAAAGHEDSSPVKEPSPSGPSSSSVAASLTAPQAAPEMLATPPSTPPASAGRQRGGRLLHVATATAAAAVVVAAAVGDVAGAGEGSAVPAQDAPAASTTLPAIVPSAVPATGALTAPAEAVATAEAAPSISVKSQDPAPSMAVMGRQGSGIVRQSSMGGGRRLSNTSAEWLSSLPPQLTETAGAKPPQGPFPFQRMPTEKMSREMLNSAPSSAEGRQRRGSKMVQAQQLLAAEATGDDAMEVMIGSAEVSPPTGPPPRRPSNGSIAFLGGRRNSKGVPVVVVSQAAGGGDAGSPKSPHHSSDGHTTPSDQNSDVEEGIVGHHVQLQKHVLQPAAAAHTAAAHTAVAVPDSVPQDSGAPMDVDTESSSTARAAAPVSATAAAVTPKRSSGTSTFLGFNFRRTSLNS